VPFDKAKGFAVAPREDQGMRTQFGQNIFSFSY
jgi:hypothetical protein